MRKSFARRWSGLENGIYEGCEESGYAVIVNEFAVADFHKKMEIELATSSIIPPYHLRQPVEVSAVVSKIASDTFRATHALTGPTIGWHSGHPIEYLARGCAYFHKAADS